MLKYKKNLIFNLKIPYIIKGLVLLLAFLHVPFTHSLTLDQTNKNIKLLVLIIASDDAPIYVELQKIWKSYMHDNPQIEAYFIKGNPHLSTTYEIQDDIIWSKTVENLIPGIANKTILSMEAMLPRIDEFDYILRTNLSSFYVFQRLLPFLEQCPKTNFYAGSRIEDGIGSGSGFIISPDVLKLLVNNKQFFLNGTLIDDILIGIFLRSNQVPLMPLARMDFLTLDTWFNNQHNIPQHIFQIRVKNLSHHLRLEHDIYIHRQLLKMFYNKQ